ncbi:hypothetical protein DBV15_12339, partial [Temnothorax longispinosus]
MLPNIDATEKDGHYPIHDRCKREYFTGASMVQTTTKKKYDMDNVTANKLPSQVDRTASDRREGSTVPAALVSSSDDGLSSRLRASLGEELAIAQGSQGSGSRRERTVKPGIGERSTAENLPNKMGVDALAHETEQSDATMDDVVSISNEDKETDSSATAQTDLQNRAEEKEDKRLRHLLDPSAPAQLSKNRKARELKMMDELREAPTRDLPNRVLEAVRMVDKVCSTAKRLRGTDQGCLIKAAATITAAINHMVTLTGKTASTGNKSTTTTGRKDAGPTSDKRASKGSSAPRETAKQAEEAWQIVSKKRNKGGQANQPASGKGRGKAEPPLAKGKPAVAKPAPAKTTSRSKQATEAINKKAARKKPPRSAAIVITSAEGGYEDLLREARTKINPAEMGFTAGFRPKRAQTGVLIIEIPGRENGPKADLLADSLAKLFADRPIVKISRPKKTSELRVLDLEDSISAEKIAEKIAGIGECPLAAANAVLQGDGRIMMGWFAVRVQALESRPLQCFKCLEGGHVRSQCPSEADRSARCYRCGGDGHRARDCKGTPCCPVCSDLGRPANHRAGGRACQPARKKARPGRRVGRGNGGPSNAAGSESRPRPQRPTVTGMETVNVKVKVVDKRPRKRAASIAVDEDNGKGDAEKPLPQRRKKNRDGSTAGVSGQPKSVPTQGLPTAGTDPKLERKEEGTPVVALEGMPPQSSAPPGVPTEAPEISGQIGMEITPENSPEDTKGEARGMEASNDE